MQREENMIVDERRKYLRLVAPRYAKAGRAEQQARLAALYAETNPRRLSRYSTFQRPESVSYDSSNPCQWPLPWTGAGMEARLAGALRGSGGPMSLKPRSQESPGPRPGP